MMVTEINSGFLSIPHLTCMAGCWPLQSRSLLRDCDITRDPGRRMYHVIHFGGVYQIHVFSSHNNTSCPFKLKIIFAKYLQWHQGCPPIAWFTDGPCTLPLVPAPLLHWTQWWQWSHSSLIHSHSLRRASPSNRAHNVGCRGSCILGNWGLGNHSFNKKLM